MWTNTCISSEKIPNEPICTLLSTFYKIVSEVIRSRAHCRFMAESLSPWKIHWRGHMPKLIVYLASSYSLTFQKPLTVFLLNLSFLPSDKFSIIMVNWVSTLLHNLESQTILNGNTSPRISLGKRCRQGDPRALVHLSNRDPSLKISCFPGHHPMANQG